MIMISSDLKEKIYRMNASLKLIFEEAFFL